VRGERGAALGRAWKSLAGLLILASCGAGEDSAPKAAPLTRCVTVETRLQPLVDLANQGRLRHIAALIQHDVDEPSQRALVQVVLAIGAALPAGSAQKLPGLLADPRTTSLVPVIVALLAPLPGKPGATPPDPPHTQEMTAFSAIVRSCHSPGLFQALTGLLREPDLPPALDLLLGVGTQAAPQLRGALQASGVQGRPGFVALVRDALTSMAAPGFQVEPLAQALQGLEDPQHPGAIDALVVLLQRFAHTHAGLPTPDRTAALQDLAGCILRSDPDGRVAGHLYDVLITPLDLPTPASATTPDASQTATLLVLLSYAMEVLAGDEAARDALGQVMGLVLRPDLATEAIPELLDLLQSKALPGILALLGDLIEQPCRAGADQ
jgi:hypothetical protein